MYQIDYIKDFWYFCGNLLQLIVFTCHFIFEPRLHVEPYRSKNRPPIAAAGAGYKIADNIVCVPQGPLNTSRQVVCFHHKIPTGLHMLPDYKASGCTYWKRDFVRHPVMFSSPSQSDSKTWKKVVNKTSLVAEFVLENKGGIVFRLILQMFV